MPRDATRPIEEKTGIEGAQSKKTFDSASTSRAHLHDEEVEIAVRRPVERRGVERGGGELVIDSSRRRSRGGRRVRALFRGGAAAVTPPSAALVKKGERRKESFRGRADDPSLARSLGCQWRLGGGERSIDSSERRQLARACFYGKQRPTALSA